MELHLVGKPVAWPQRGGSEEITEEKVLGKKRTLADCLVDDCFLPSKEFLDQLRKEKRRSDRSQAPLSIALLHLDESSGTHGNQLELLMDSLRNKTRETDIKGWVDSKSIGLILPDTDRSGLDRLVELIIQGNGHVNYSISKGTYPHTLFEKLLETAEEQPNLFPIEFVHSSQTDTCQHFLKRPLDIVGSLIGLILVSPLMLITSLAIKLSSPGPVIFKQTRLGPRGIRFPFYKFRSMYVENDDRCHREFVAGLIEGKHELLNQGDRDRPFFKIRNDDRITPVGKIIRRFSLDELPQFFNVLKGEMSLVGPRPPIPYEVEKYKPWHLRRILEIKPGITGLWQVEGRSRTSFDEMVRLDLRYLMNWSFWLDIKILFKTIKAVIETKGAV
jgi:exopolysaccharide biosynthesis polyprenyl glycosylphosphotransferase